MSAPAHARRWPGSGGGTRPAPAPRVRMGCVHDYLVPIDDEACMRFFTRTLFSARSRRDRVFVMAPAWVARPLWSLVAGDVRRVPLGPCGEPQIEPGPGARHDPSGSVWRGQHDARWLSCAQLVIEGLRADNPTQVPGALRALRWVARCQVETTARRLVLFAFDQGASQPSAVLKVRSGVAGQGPLGREWEALRGLERQPDLRNSVPRPLAFRAAGPLEVLWQTWIPGRSAYTDLHRSLTPGRHVARHFDAAADWLSRFHGATHRPAASFTLADLEVLSDTIRLRTGVTIDGTGWCRELRSLMPASGVPVAAGHGDFWPRNLLLDRSSRSRSGPRDRAAVVDWEESTKAAPVFLDLFTFPLSYGLNYPWRQLRRVPAVRAFQWTFLEDTPVAREVRRYLQRYCQALDLEGALVGRLLPLFLLMRWAANTPTASASPGADATHDQPWQTLYALSVESEPFVFCA